MPYFGTSRVYFCIVKQKKQVAMNTFSYTSIESISPFISSEQSLSVLLDLVKDMELEITDVICR